MNVDPHHDKLAGSMAVWCQALENRLGDDKAGLACLDCLKDDINRLIEIVNDLETDRLTASVSDLPPVREPEPIERSDLFESGDKVRRVSNGEEGIVKWYNPRFQKWYVHWEHSGKTHTRPERMELA